MDLVVPGALSHQVDPWLDPVKNKVLRWGRRSGKTRLDVLIALMGHGPLVDGVRLRPGILTSKLDVAWICPTYKQSDPLWLEEIQPRFKGKPYCTINETDKWVQCGDLGRLFVRTWENASTIRGQGARLGGVIFDEAAHMDCRSMWAEFILYALMDNEGWSIWSSTTNADLDGNPDRLPPSFFNVICQEIEQGVRDPKLWKQWYATARDNPLIGDAVLEETIDEALRSGGQRRVDQEVFALILAPGSGLAFPTWRYAVHVRDIPFDEGWGCVGTLDWGSTDPGAFYLLLQGPGGRLALRCEVYFNGPTRADWPERMTAEMVGTYVGNRIKAFEKKHGLRPEFISADSAMWAITGVGVTIAGLFQKGLDAALGERAPQLYPTPKGPGSRATRKELLTEALHWTEDSDHAGLPTAEGWPLLAVGTDCPHFAREIPLLPNDKLDPEKVADGSDHCLAGWSRVWTPQGWTPISDIDGARITRYDAPTLRLEVDECCLTLTPEHRVLTPSGWVEARHLSVGSPILWWEPWESEAGARRCTGARRTTYAGPTSSDRSGLVSSGDCTNECGPTPTARSRPGIMFTTGMETRPIIGSPTSAVSRGGITSVSMPRIPARPGSQHGEPTPSDPVGRAISASLQRNAVRRLSRITLGERTDVYDLGVASSLHAFIIESGWVVHNCFDSATYGLHTLLPEYDEDSARGRAQDRERELVDSLSRREAEQYEALERKAAKAARRSRS